jgi:alpha-glucosidase
MYHRSGGVDPGRDGCRVPLPWSGTEAPFGFSPAGATAETWLRQPDSWAARTVESQHDDPGSMLSLYRASLQIRRDDQDLHTESMRWLDAPEGVLAFARGSRFVAITNLSPDAVALPADGALLLASAELEDGRLPSDASAWIRLHDNSLARGAGWPTREAG